MGASMKTNRLFLFFLPALFLLVPIAYSQYTPINILSQPGYNRVGNDFWASGGAGITEYGLHAAAFANPALLSFDALTLTAETGWRPKTDYLAGINYDNSTILPSYASLGMPFGPVSVEAGYTRSYDEHLLIEGVMFTTQQQPDGPGQLVNIENTTTIHTAFVSMGITFPEGASIGLTTGLDFVRYDGDLPYNSVRATGTRLQMTAGAVVRPFAIASLGVTVHIAADDNLHYSTDSFSSIALLDSTGRTPLYPLAIATFSAKTPSSVGFGGSLDVLPWLTLLGRAEYQNWSAMENHLNDVWQYHLGAVASPIPEGTFRAGFFTQRSPSGSLTEYFNEYFLTAGASWKITQDLTASAAYLTSAPFAKKSVSVQYIYYGQSLQQSMLSGGIAYSW
jgi:hypothetical protein